MPCNFHILQIRIEYSVLLHGCTTLSFRKQTQSCLILIILAYIVVSHETRRGYCFPTRPTEMPEKHGQVEYDFTIESRTSNTLVPGT